MINPYDPQSPAKPDYFGGRHMMLEKAEERISKACINKQSGGILIYGYRGVGKTSLLTKIISLAKEKENAKNSIFIYRRLSKTTSDSEFYQMMIETIKDEIEQRQSIISRASSNINSAKVFNVEFIFDTDWEKKTPYFKWISFMKNAKNISYILIAIDDADYLSPEALGELKTVVESQTNIPIILCISGAMDFEEKLVDDYSPIARVFSGSSFNIGEFKFDETSEVLIKPVQGSDTAWSQDAIAEVHRLSRGYPYLVQCLASASYIDGGVISASHVRDCLNDALDIGKPWLSHELEQASDNDIKSFLKIIKIGTQVIKTSDMQNSGIAPPYVGRLVKLGVIKKISRGRYVLIKPPIIAYFHEIKRNLHK